MITIFGSIVGWPIGGLHRLLTRHPSPLATAHLSSRFTHYLFKPTTNEIMSVNKTLDTGWFFTQLTGHGRNEPGNKGTDSGEWLPAKVPTGVHEELIKASRIPDPFIGQLLGLCLH